MGAFGGYTRWAVVFLVIFVLFFLLVPAGVYHAAPAPAPVATVAYTEYDEVIETGPMYGYWTSSPHGPRPCHARGIPRAPRNRRVEQPVSRMQR